MSLAPTTITTAATGNLLALIARAQYPSINGQISTGAINQLTANNWRGRMFMKQKYSKIYCQIRLKLQLKAISRTHLLVAPIY